MEKLYKRHKIYGYLHTLTGQTYFLCSPQPLPKDSWQSDHQQTWVVMDNHLEDSVEIGDKSVGIFASPITVITSFPTIELINLDDKFTWEGEYYNEAEVELPLDDQEPSLEDLEWIQLEMKIAETYK